MPPKKEKEVLVRIKDEIKIKHDRRFWIPVIISFIAVTISGLSLTISMNWFSSFDLSIYSNGAYLYKATSTETGYKEITTFIVPLMFLNNGQGGVVDDIVLNISYLNYTFTYMPRYEINIQKFHGMDFWETKNVIEKPFQSFPLAKGGTETKMILFGPDTSLSTINNSYNFDSYGHYILEVYARNSDSRLYEKELLLELNITKEAFDASSSGNKVFLRSGGGYGITTRNSTTIKY